MTTNTKHTPGPWYVQIKAGQTWILTDPQHKCDGSPDVNGSCCIAQLYGPDASANASLIVVSKELRAALEDCVTAYDLHRSGQPTGNLWPDPNHIFSARAVIAKSLGVGAEYVAGIGWMAVVNGGRYGNHETHGEAIRAAISMARRK